MPRHILEHLCFSTVYVHPGGKSLENLMEKVCFHIRIESAKYNSIKPSVYSKLFCMKMLTLYLEVLMDHKHKLGKL